MLVGSLVQILRTVSPALIVCLPLLVLAWNETARAQQGARSAPTNPLTQALESPLVTDLSSHLISISSSFTGTDLLIFGAVDQPGEIIVVLRGPQGRVVVRKKRRVLGIWVNVDAVEFDNMPGYYAVAASQPLRQFSNQSLLQRLQIGAEHLRMPPRLGVQEEEITEFREAILRQKRDAGLYQEEASPVVFLGPKLFRARIGFPSTVPTGTYRAEVYLLRDEQVISAQATPLFIKKSGAEQVVYDFAHQQPVYYGLAAVALAMFAGWFAAAVFRKT